MVVFAVVLAEVSVVGDVLADAVVVSTGDQQTRTHWLPQPETQLLGRERARHDRMQPAVHVGMHSTAAVEPIGFAVVTVILGDCLVVVEVETSCRKVWQRLSQV